MQHFLVRDPDNTGLLFSAIEVRDAASQNWGDAEDGAFDRDADGNVSADDRATYVAACLTDLGLTVRLEPEHRCSGVPSISVQANDDSWLRLVFDAMQDGYDYDGSGDDALELEEQAADEANEARANRIAGALEETYGTDSTGSEHITDALTDIMHLSALIGEDFHTLLRRAVMHFNAERP